MSATRHQSIWWCQQHPVALQNSHMVRDLQRRGCPRPVVSIRSNLVERSLRKSDQYRNTRNPPQLRSGRRRSAWSGGGCWGWAAPRHTGSPARVRSRAGCCGSAAGPRCRCAGCGRYSVTTTTATGVAMAVSIPRKKGEPGGQRNHLQDLYLQRRDHRRAAGQEVPQSCAAPEEVRGAGRWRSGHSSGPPSSSSCPRTPTAA